MKVTPLASQHAPLLHNLYAATPNYFAQLGTKLPSLSETALDVETAEADPQRHIELIHDDAGELIGSLDYKCHYPEYGDLTINLLLIREDRQSQGWGERVVRHLEARVPDGIHRILASIFGENPRGARFWKKVGYHFALDARPILSWYAKDVRHLRLPKPSPSVNIASNY